MNSWSRISFIAILALAHALCTATSRDKSFVFVTASYNNEQWVESNLLSMFTQDYPGDWRLIYINDCSTDRTRELAYEIIELYNMWDRVTFVDNQTRRGHLANQYDAIHSCKNGEIIVNVDGDDWLPHRKVLSYLNKVYADQQVWMTYGQYKRVKHSNAPTCCRQIPANVVAENTIRSYRWCLSHLRTFYAGLFKKIKKADLMYDDGFYPVAADQATMIPMFEMAAGRYKFINDVLYVYNNTNPLNCSKVDPHIGERCVERIKVSKPYMPLKQLDLRT